MGVAVDFTCEACGQPVTCLPGLVIDEGRAEVRYGGKAGYMTMQELEVLKLLATKAGRVVTKEQLLDGLYWLRSSGEVPEIKIIDVLVCKVRKHTTALGLEIKTHWGKGYELLVPGVAPARDVVTESAGELT